MIAGSLLAAALLASSPVQADARKPSSPKGREIMHAFGVCVADASPEKAAETLRMDFRTESYRAALLALNKNNQDCDKRWDIRGGGMLFAGAMAERLIAKGAAPLKSRMARAATAPAGQSFTPADAVAVCVVRAMPDEVSTLFETPIASEAEAAAIKSLSVGFSRCAQGQPRMSISPNGARAMLATAAFRQLAASAAQGN